MAVCLPAYMPVMVAILRAMCQEPFKLWHILTLRVAQSNELSREETPIHTIIAASIHEVDRMERDAGRYLVTAALAAAMASTAIISAATSSAFNSIGYRNVKALLPLYREAHGSGNGQGVDRPRVLT
jgi:hypothetical protein